MSRFYRSGILTLIIVKAFGEKGTWNEDMKTQPDSGFALKSTLRNVSRGLLIKFLVPDFMLDCFNGLRSVKRTFTDLEVRFLFSI